VFAEIVRPKIGKRVEFSIRHFLLPLPLGEGLG
jgi:hypothetical protein